MAAIRTDSGAEDVLGDLGGDGRDLDDLSDLRLGAASTDERPLARLTLLGFDLDAAIIRWLRTAIGRDARRWHRRRCRGREHEVLAAAETGPRPDPEAAGCADELATLRHVVPDIVEVFTTLRRVGDVDMAGALLGQSPRRVRAIAKLAQWLLHGRGSARDDLNHRPPVVVMRVAGLALPDCAALLGCTEHALRKRLQRGLPSPLRRADGGDG